MAGSVRDDFHSRGRSMEWNFHLAVAPVLSLQSARLVTRRRSVVYFLSPLVCLCVCVCVSGCMCVCLYSRLHFTVDLKFGAGASFSTRITREQTGNENRARQGRQEEEEGDEEKEFSENPRASEGALKRERKPD